MGNDTESLDQVLIKLYALAAKLEGEGQYNVAKLNRAAADSLLQNSAYPIELPTERERLAQSVIEIAEELDKFDLEGELVRALKQGAMAMSQGRLPMIAETPNPEVCRTCGHVEMGFVASNCPRCGARPKTFRRYLPVYWLEAMDPFEAMTWLRKTPLEVQRLIDGLSEDDLNWSPGEGEWSIRNVLSHLRDAQGVLDYRVNLLLSEENPVIESKAVFEWARQEADRPPATKELFDTYLVSRNKTLEALEGLPLIDWWREGRHEEFGEVRLHQQVSYFATHELTHLPQIDRMRSV